MNTTTSTRFRSSFHDINLDLLKKLCDFHPWTRAELCKAVDMEASVLSMVLAGKRPLPGRVAKKFLALMGMKDDGSLDHMHGFVFRERAGRESELLEFLEQLYPEDPIAFGLKVSVADPVNLEKPPFFRLGLVLISRRYQCIVHTPPGSKLHLRWTPLKAEDVQMGVPPEVLMSLTNLPSKLDIAQAIANHVLDLGPKWPDVIQAARKRNVSPRDVLAWLEANYSVPRIEP